MAAPKNADDWSVVETCDDFLVLVQLLAQEWEADEGRRRVRQAEGLWAGEDGVWAHGTPGAWLEAMRAWLSALGRNTHESLPVDVDTPNWKTFAFILSASRRYE